MRIGTFFRPPSFGQWPLFFVGHGPYGPIKFHSRMNPAELLKFKVYLLDFFCSSIQFYLLLSPYLCFISLLYLDLYVLGDDALIS